MKNKLVLVAAAFSLLGLLELKYNPLHVSLQSQLGQSFSQTVQFVSFITGVYLIVKAVGFIYGSRQAKK
jgi:hypothetical protein